MNKSLSGFNAEQAQRFITKLGGKEYVGRDGRSFKMDQRFGGGGYDVIPRVPTQEEYTFIKKMMGLDDSAGCIIMVGEIFVEGKMKYRDFGVATEANMPGGNKKQFALRGLEIATTRAVNRAMGLGIAGGFADNDDKYERQGYRPATDSAQAEFLKQMQEIKKSVGDTEYYAVLHRHGYEKSNDPQLCTDADAMMAVLNDYLDVNEDDEQQGQFVRDKLKEIESLSDSEDQGSIWDALLDAVMEQPAMQRALDDGTTVGDKFLSKYADRVMSSDFDGLHKMFLGAAGMIDSQ